MSNNSQIPFAPLGKSVLVTSDTVAPTAVQAPVYTRFDEQNAGQYRVINSGSNIVYLGVGSTASEAQSNAVAPIVGTPSAAIVLLPGAVEILRFGINSYFSGLASSATNVFIVPGQGL